MNRRVAYGLAVLAQLVFLGWMVAAQEHLRAHGRRVVISIEPVDPIDPMAGRYLAIQPQPGRVDLTKVSSSLALEHAQDADSSLVGQQVDVTLREEDGLWIASSIGYPTHDHEGALFLRGRVRSAYGSLVFVDFGLERFYIPADASDPSPLLWQTGHKLAIEVKVSTEGEGSVTDLLIDGESFASWNRAQQKK
jgi:uncharacterized membrane-anchored protein